MTHAQNHCANFVCACEPLGRADPVLLNGSHGAQASLEYVMRLPGVRVNRKKVTTAGVSNGGYMAAPVASRYTIYTHAILFHATCVHLGFEDRMRS